MCQLMATFRWGARIESCVLCTSTSFPGSIRPLFGLTQYLEEPRQWWRQRKGSRAAYCLGAVVLTFCMCQQGVRAYGCRVAENSKALLTLKATGSECGFFRRRVCDTSC